MAVINLKDKRYLTKEGDKVILHIDYEDVYDQINIDHMLKSQLKIKKVNNDFLDNYKNIKKNAYDITKSQMQNVKIENEKFLEDIKDSKKAEEYKIKLLEAEIGKRRAFIENFDNEVEKLYSLAIKQLDAGKKDSEIKIKDSEATIVFWKDYMDIDRINKLEQEEQEKIKQLKKEKEEKQKQSQGIQ